VKRILILVHESEPPPEEWPFLISSLNRAWDQRGIVARIAYGTTKVIDADVIINHVDLTTTPKAYRAYLRRYPVAINGSLLDISKDRFSNNLLAPGDAYQGKVIVKTKINAGGRRELVLAAQSSFAGRVAYRRARGLTSGRRASLGSRTHYFDGGRYPVFDSIQDVPPGVWRYKRLVVEKLLTEREGDYFVLRAWYFLGSRSFNVRLLSVEPVVKGPDIVAREVLADTVPMEVRRVREALGADYGRIDYAIVDGVPVVYDINRTPSTTPGAREQYRTELAYIARGIDDF